MICQSEVREIEGFSQRILRTDAIYEKELFEKIGDIEKKMGLNILQRSNMDDNGDYRPGLIAKRAGVKYPLREAKLTKAD